MIISDFNPFGLKLYERIRLSDKIIHLNFDKVNCDDIGIYLVGEYPRLKYNHVSISQKHEWNKLAFETISLTILNLINLKLIEVYEYIDNKTYIFNLINIKSKGYYLKNNSIDNIGKTDDLLSKSILNFISISHSKHKTKTNIYKVIHSVLNKYLGDNEEYSRPAKQFLIKNLNKYAKKFNWIKINEQKKLLGIYKDYQLEINEIYIPRIKMQHKEIKSLQEHLYNSNIIYKCFSDELKKCLEIDFKRREPSSGDTD